MSRVGKKPIVVPKNVQVSIQDSLFKVKGPKGELEYKIPGTIQCKIENNEITFSRTADDKKVRAIHGLSRAITANMIEGVSNGFTKVLQIQGVGYKVEMKGNRLMLSLGFSHPILVLPPDGITFASPNPNTINITGIDKQRVGEVAAVVRRLRPPEPYKGKGIRLENEYVRRKAGKTTAK